MYKCKCGQSWNEEVNDFKYCPDCGTSVTTGDLAVVERVKKVIKIFECFERTANFQNRPTDMGHWSTARFMLTDILNADDANIDDMLKRAERWIEQHIGS